MSGLGSIFDWLRRTYDVDGEKISNGESLLVISLMVGVGLGMTYLLYRQLFPARRITSRCSGPAPALGSLRPEDPPAGPGH